MAKQTFTTGQVLTAAQMTSLQETAMGGGPATAKTASYVLVAADAGKTVAMNAAGATTITVNTGLFAAGDTVFIQNLGAGACTVTAGTATVATAGSAILPQNDAGILYFTATGASIFYDFIQVGAASPLTTKGDLYTFGTSDTRLAVGATNGMVLTVDSAEATGLKFATPAAGGGMTLLSTTTLTGASTTISSIDTTYKYLKMIINGARSNTGLGDFQLRINGDTSTNYTRGYIYVNQATVGGNAYVDVSAIDLGYGLANQTGVEKTGQGNFEIHNYSATSGGIIVSGTMSAFANTTHTMSVMNAVYEQSAACTSLTFIAPSGNNFAAGTVYLYGVK